jgi:hypothetical protein
VAERLKQAAMEGRILAHELEDRLAAALRARTYGDLDDVVADLPGGRLAQRSRPRARELMLAQPVAAVAVIVAATLVVFVLAAVVLAGLAALSGIWVVIGLILLMHRGGGRRNRGRRGGPRARATRGAWW